MLKQVTNIISFCEMNTYIALFSKEGVAAFPGFLILENVCVVAYLTNRNIFGIFSVFF